MKKIISILLSCIILISSIAGITVFADDYASPTFIVSDVSGKAGETVKVNVSLLNNPGIISFRVRITYDSDSLELISGEPGVLGTSFGPTTKNPFTFSWYDAIHGDYTTTGVVAKLTFKIKDDAPVGESAITLSYLEDDVFNTNYENVHFDIDNGIATVEVTPVSATGVSLDKDTLSLKTGESEQLIANILPENATNKAVTWESSDPDVATVDENGNVTGIKEGTSTITVITDDGSFTDTCAVTVDCSHSSTTVIPAVSSTCIEHGHGEYTVCNDCGAVVSGSDAELPLAPHNYVENAQEEYLVSAATCVDKAVYYKNCSVCGAAGTETFEYGEVDPSNHIGETYITDQREATCYYEGYTGNVYCGSCNQMISAGTETPLAEHTYGEWVEITKPTCTEPGEETRVCEVCGADETRPVAATGHTPGEWSEVTAPTCTEEGLEEQRCTVCGDQIATRAIPATGHTLGEWTTTIEPTCTEEGEREAFCEECGVRFTEPVPATGHTAGEWEITMPATCTEDGVRTTTCTVCGVEYTEVIPATGHQYSAWTVVKEATETEEGLRERVCSACGEKESEVIPMLSAEETETTEATTSSANASTSSNTDTKSPKTGLETDLVIFSVIGAAATVVVVLTVSRKKKSLNK